METIKVKGLELGDGHAKVCVPLVGRTHMELENEMVKILAAEPDMVEWRVDYYEAAEDTAAVLEELGKIRSKFPGTAIIFTFRSKKEGGAKEIDLNQYIALNQAVAESKLADFIDVELFSGDQQVAELCNWIHESGGYAIVSSHDFQATPIKPELTRRIKKALDLGGDIPKIAVMPQKPEDVLTLFEASLAARSEFGGVPLIAISMGKLGLASRICGSVFGSAVTFAAAGAASAPGQVPVEKLRKCLDLVELP